MNIYCTYLTVYFGSKMPPFYIGSSRVEKVNNGYRGSVKSKMYKTIWEYELTNNPHLFKTIIISTHSTRTEALSKEEYFHRKLNVMPNSMYINRSIASGLFGALEVSKETRIKMSKASKGKPKSEDHKNKLAESNRKKAADPEFRKKLKKPKPAGFGLKVSNAMTGRKKTKEHCENISKALKGKKTGPCSEERKNAISKALKGNHPNPNKDKTYEEIYGEEKALELKKIRSELFKNIAKNSKPIVCPHCGKTIVGSGNYSRWHGDNCKEKMT